MIRIGNDMPCLKAGAEAVRGTTPFRLPFIIVEDDIEKRDVIMEGAIEKTQEVTR